MFEDHLRMLRQFNRLIALALLIAVTLYITLTNSDTATIKLGPNITVTTYAGVIYLGVFFVGCVVASVVALFFGFKSYLRERKLRAAARSHQLFFELFLKARSFMASEEWGAARAIWEQVLHQDPENTIARVELATCIENLGEPREALRVLDSMRASNHMNAAVLFKAVELNRELGNNTAAKDNLALIVQEAPTKRALELARDIAEELGRFDDAMDYHRALEKVGHISEKMIEAKTRISFEQLIRSVENENSLRETLTIFVKKHPQFVPALERLAQLEIARGRLDEGAELLVKAAKLSEGDLSKWNTIIDLWLRTSPGDVSRRADRAIAAARSATQGLHGAKRIDAEFVVAKTLLAVHRSDDARTLLENVSALAEKERVGLTPAQAQLRTHLLGLSMSRLGLSKDTASLWESLGEPTLPVTETGKKPLLSDRGEPSPALSTP
jgi:thioredoxin-like negative regulator of GroEL